MPGRCAGCSASALLMVVGLAAVAVLLAAQEAAAIAAYQAQIPNGNSVVNRAGAPHPAVGHTAASGGGARNQFGVDFAAAAHTWTTALCDSDSDGDGLTNGQELGDPDCVWSPGQTPSRTTDITHPGERNTDAAATVAGCWRLALFVAAGSALLIALF